MTKKNAEKENLHETQFEPLMEDTTCYDAASLVDALSEAAKRIEERKEQDLLRFLQNTEFDQPLKDAICNDQSSLNAAIPRNPAVCNVAGLMPLHLGMSDAGGNNSDINGNQSIGVCFNGGLAIGGTEGTKQGPVPGGSQNCVRCRWFVTGPHYLPALLAHFNNLSHYCDQARETARKSEDELNVIKKQKADPEVSGQPFTQFAALLRSEAMLEEAMKEFSDLLLAAEACSSLIRRCKEALLLGTKQ